MKDLAGWICLHRRLLEWEWYDDINVTRLFVHLLLRANFKPKRWQGKIIERGQLATGRRMLSQETGLTEQQTRTALDKLKSTNEITTKSTNEYTIITLCNYSLYQDENSREQPANQPASQPTNNQPITNEQPLLNKETSKQVGSAREAFRSEAPQSSPNWREKAKAILNGEDAPPAPPQEEDDCPPPKIWHTSGNNPNFKNALALTEWIKKIFDKTFFQKNPKLEWRQFTNDMASALDEHKPDFVVTCAEIVYDDQIDANGGMSGTAALFAEIEKELRT